MKGRVMFRDERERENEKERESMRGIILIHRVIKKYIYIYFFCSS